MDICENCIHALHDTTWGERKCDVYNQLIRNVDEPDCLYFENGDKKSTEE